MGLCLDTERSSDSLEDEGQSWFQNSPRNSKSTYTPPDGQFSMLNGSNVQFEIPKVPVIFVIGGPGSGKVTHCDNLVQERLGIVHINLTDLLQQYTIGNDMHNFCQLSSTTVAEVLMLEMKMAPNSKGYLVSGYPRNMKDVVEYSEKIQKLSGVILIVWREKVLERQINYGAKLGQVVVSLARMELKNFFKNVVPVAEYFDHSNLLTTINGEKQPDEVYEEFKNVVFNLISEGKNNVELSKPADGIISSSASPEMSTAIITDNTALQPTINSSVVISSKQVSSLTSATNDWPKVIWIIGGPGSNKAILCDLAAADSGWAHISLGRLLRSTVDIPDDKNSQEKKLIRECLVAGELVPLQIVLNFIKFHLSANRNVPGVLLDGYPRNMEQLTEFEKVFDQKPTLILLDCSKLQLGRGRIDDSVTAFRRRLEIFRQLSLPMLKLLDNVGRLSIIDGDTDATLVREDFLSVVNQHIQYIKHIQNSVSEDYSHIENLINFSHTGNKIKEKSSSDRTVSNMNNNGKDSTQILSGMKHIRRNGISTLKEISNKANPQTQEHITLQSATQLNQNKPYFNKTILPFD